MMGMTELDRIRALRKKLHETPEGALHEEKTKEILLTFLKEETDLEVFDRGLWFYALKRGSGLSDQSTIAFRADLDAVPLEEGGFAHLCGHDGHVAILAGLALSLTGETPKRDVLLIFQPGEETGQGAALVMEERTEEKVFSNISEIYALHNIPGRPEGSILIRHGTFACASEGWEMRFKGEASHAAYPEKGKNPAMVMAHLIQGIEASLKERTGGSILLSTVVGISLGGEAYGVSPGEGILRLTLRGEDPEEFEAFKKMIRSLAREMCREAGLGLEITRHDPFPPTVNDPACLDHLESAAREAGLACLYPEEPFRWSEDFGHFLKKFPGAMLGLGSGEACPPLHTRDYEFPDGILAAGLALYRGLIGSC